MKNDKLEKKILFRLIRVVYIIFLMLAVATIVVVGWFSRPIKEVDESRSYISCYSGVQYTLANAGIYVYSLEDKELLSTDDREARKLCAYGVLNDYSTQYNRLVMPQSQNYKLNLQPKIVGSWGSTFLWWFFGVGGVYILLNILRETLNYILFEKSFDWLWLLVPIALISSAYKENTA